LALIKRVSKDAYYLGIAEAVTERAVCFRRVSGAIIVRDDQIVATGYTGPPRKTLDCFQRGYCLREKLQIPSGQRYELFASVHAEQNVIINSARAGVSLLGGDIYVFGRTLEGKPIDAFPCFICKKMIINAGLARVICSAKDGLIRIFHVEDWIKEWQETDREIVDDKIQYGAAFEKDKI
jgi:dCMP deaminase